MTVLVTGASGLVGRSIIKSLVKDGVELRLLAGLLEDDSISTSVH